MDIRIRQALPGEARCLKKRGKSLGKIYVNAIKKRTKKKGEGIIIKVIKLTYNLSNWQAE